MKTLRLLVLVVLFLLAGQAAYAANHFIRSGAAGAGTGADWTNAWTDLPASLVRGDTYYVAGGSYGAHTFKDAASGSTIITLKKATAADHGTDTGWQSSFGTTQAVFNGMFDFNSPYYTIDGVTGGGAANGWNQNLGFKVYSNSNSLACLRINFNGTGAHDITVRHVELQGSGLNYNVTGGYYSNHGVAVYNGAINTTLSYAWIHDLASCPFAWYGSGAGGNGSMIEHVYVQSFYGDNSAHSEVMSYGQGAKGDVTFRYNLIAWVWETGGIGWNNYYDTNAHLYIYGNVFYQPPTLPTASNGSTYSSSNYIVNSNGWIMGWSGSPPTRDVEFMNVYVYNNSFVNITYLPLSTLLGAYSNNHVYNNIFYNTKTISFNCFPDHDYNTFIQSGSGYGEAHEVDAPNGGNPFVNISGLDFRLTGDTAAGDSTLTLPSGSSNMSKTLNIDPLGVMRGADGVWDRGAFQFGGTTTGGGSATISPNPPSNLRVM